MLQIYCKNNNSTREFPEGSSLLDIYNGFNLAMPYGPVSAKVNNKVESLDFRVYYNKDIEFLDITSSSGMRTYVRSLFFILVKAVEELYPQGSISLEIFLQIAYRPNHRAGRRAAHQAENAGNHCGRHSLYTYGMPHGKSSPPV